MLFSLNSIRTVIGGALVKWPRLASLLKKTGKKSVQQLYQLNKQANEFKEKFIQEWKRTGIDVLLCPPYDTV